MKLAHRDGRPWYQEPWPWILMAGPAVVIVAGIITTWLAVRSSDGLVADDYYKQGLAVNQELARDQRAQTLGIQAELLWADRQVRVFMSGKELTSEPLQLRIVHPTRAGEDQVLTLQSEGGNLFGATLTRELAPGRWNVVLEDKAATWRLQGVWKTGTTGPLRLQAGPLQSASGS